MKALTAIYASKERGMQCVFASKKLKKLLTKYEEKMLRLVISRKDEEGYVLERYENYVVIGKITRVEGSCYDSRATNVYHFYFLTEEQYKQIQKFFCEGKTIIFISTPEADIKQAEEICFSKITEEEKRMSVWDNYSLEMCFYSFLALVVSKRRTRICNDCDLSNKELFYYLNSMFALDGLVKKTYLIGCQSYYGEMRRWECDKVVVCKEFLMNEESEMLSHLCFDPNELFFKYGEASQYFKLNVEQRKAIFHTAFLNVLKGNALDGGEYEETLISLKERLEVLKGERSLSTFWERKKIKKAIKCLIDIGN